MRPINIRMCKDTVIVHATAFDDDAEGAPQADDASASPTTVEGVMVQPIELTGRSTEATDGDSEAVPLGTSRANILFRTAPPEGIAAKTLIEHSRSGSAVFDPTIAYRAEGPPIPPSGGMSCWTVAVSRRD